MNRRDAEIAEINLNALASHIIGAAIKVHRVLGPGLLESAYQACLAYELRKKGFQVETELRLPIQYEEVHIDAGYRIDMLIENKIIVENKVVEHFLPVHEAQLLTYLKMKECHLGYLLNWHVPVLKDGIKRMVHNL